MVALDSIQMQATGEQETQTLRQFDQDLTGTLNDDATGSVYLEEGEYNISNSSQIRITSSNGFEELSNETIPMGTLTQKGESGNIFGYQAGGIWKNNGGSTTVVSRPDLRYYKDGEYGRIDFSVTNLTGNAGPGENTVTSQKSTTSEVDTPSQGEFVSHVEITVEGTQYHDGWYRFMSDEFNATDAKSDNCDFDVDVSFDQNLICHDPGDQTVTVIATIDGNNPFAHHVGIEPTIYGGLSADSIDSINGGSYEDDLNVSGYSNHNRSNASHDLFTVDSGFELSDGADIEGYPVINGQIDPKFDSAVTPIGYVSDPNFETRDANRRYTTNGTDVAHLTDSVIAANMSRPFDSHEGIDSEIEDSALSYLKDHDSNEKVTSFGSGKDSIDESGRYYTDEFNVNSINTSDGDVHIGVGGFKGGTLSDLTVTGENQVYIYTDESVTIGEVDTNNQAGTFWLYGTSSTAITFENDASFEGVIYAPGSQLDIEDHAEITGAVVGGATKIGNNVTINFDRSLRTDVPISDEDQDITVEEARSELDVTFVLDGSGSMGDTGTVTGDYWQDPPDPRWAGTSTLSVVSNETHSLEARQCISWGWISCQEYSEGVEIEPGESFDYSHDVRVKNGSSSTTVTVEYGNDPHELRSDATKDFIGSLNESTDRVGAFEFDTGGKTFHNLSDEFDSVNESITVSAGGQTDMSQGMELALNQPYDPNHDRVMVLLSDGKNSDEDANTRTEDKIEDAISKDVTIYTIGLGNDLNETLLKKAATDTGGEYYPIDDDEELKEKFNLIANRVTADEDITFNVGDIPNPGESSSDYVVNVETQQVRIEN
ncbi:von Willebrand factor A [Natrinema versiforme JCM 10478]|uniref:von Willebrand factor A n=2 Tax=Natrinema versiforme TaxID=88724 RepID=L9Y196_9EURY|nr:von Willebrand factor A [Natrinema versiforme JCM 10478]